MEVYNLDQALLYDAQITLCVDFKPVSITKKKGRTLKYFLNFLKFIKNK
jgi:hypothetical protein